MLDNTNNELQQTAATSPQTTNLAESTNEIVDKIIEENNIENLKELTALFNINQNKKNLLRILKLNGLLDKISDQAIDRIENHPDEITNKELLDYMVAVENSIDKAQKSINNIENTNLIQINDNHTEIKVNTQPEFSKESRDKILDVVATILASVNTKNENNQ